MVDPSICCSEHDVLMSFSEHGGTLMMSWISWPEPRRRVVDVLQTISIYPKLTSSRSLGHQTLLSIVLGCTCARSERIHSLIGDVWPGEWAVILDSIQTRGLDQIDLQTCFNGHVFGLSEDGHVDVVVPLILMAWKWIIRKNHLDETLPPWWVLVGVGRKSDGEAGNVCIKGDAAAYTPEACAAPVAIFGLSSGRTSECMGQVPGILRGRILGRLRIRGMRISSCLIRMALLAPLELVKAVMDFHSCLRARGTFSMFVLVLGDNLVDSWYRSRSLGHATIDVGMTWRRAFMEPGGPWACSSKI
ncbi:hypothetical protein HID58_048348 [Brassica napus]|uniref:Uncharacterized protein n=1 Tax=Brassica napus TaxID=3708 RepID=A0ABQ8B3F1_BRANA|nr:hypothetical protein HID58_048348 [Brassica napus]